MAKPVISYDKDLPEMPDRRSREEPTSYLRKKVIGFEGHPEGGASGMRGSGKEK